MRDAVRQLESQTGPTDLLIASAGVGQETSADAFSAEVFSHVIQVNLIGVSNSIAAVLPGMRERRRGHLAALSSLASYRGLPRMAGYSASKAGVNALMDSLRVELRNYGIACSTICPGWIRTPMTAPLSCWAYRCSKWKTPLPHPRGITSPSAFCGVSGRKCVAGTLVALLTTAGRRLVGPSRLAAVAAPMSGSSWNPCSDTQRRRAVAVICRISSGAWNMNTSPP